MRHGRPDYARIQDPMGIIPEDEPVFLLRARDAGAPLTVLAWSSAQEAAGADPEVVAKAREWAQVMSAYQAEHGMKLPDLPADEVVWPDGDTVDWSGSLEPLTELAPVGSRWKNLHTHRVVEVDGYTTHSVMGHVVGNVGEPRYVITRGELRDEWERVYTAAEDLVEADIVDDDELEDLPAYGTPPSYVPRRANPETVAVSDPVWQAIQRVMAANPVAPTFILAARIVTDLHQAGHLTTTYPESCPASS